MIGSIINANSNCYDIHLIAEREREKRERERKRERESYLLFKDINCLTLLWSSLHHLLIRYFVIPQLACITIID